MINNSRFYLQSWVWITGIFLLEHGDSVGLLDVLTSHFLMKIISFDLLSGFHVCGHNLCYFICLGYKR